MANEVKDQEEVKVPVPAVTGAGAVIRSNMVILTKAYAEMDIATIELQREFMRNLGAILSEYRLADNRAWDEAMKGYISTDWMVCPVRNDKGKILNTDGKIFEGKEKEEIAMDTLPRLIKKDPENPRGGGRKAQVKADPVEGC